MHRLFTTLIVSLLVIFTAGPQLGCEGESTVDIDTFVNDYAQTFCDYHFKCCSSMERSYGSSTACENEVGQLVEQLFAYRDGDAPQVTFLEADAGACLDKLRAKDCKDANLRHGCIKQALAAGRSEGEECTFSAECKSYYCIQGQKDTPGSCGASGSGCSGIDWSCSSGSYCGAGNQCLKKIENGEVCGKGRECRSGICSPSYKQCVGAVDPICDGK